MKTPLVINASDQNFLREATAIARVRKKSVALYRDVSDHSGRAYRISEPTVPDEHVPDSWVFLGVCFEDGDWTEVPEEEQHTMKCLKKNPDPTTEQCVCKVPIVVTC